MDFKTLKKNSGKIGLEKLNEELNKTDKKEYEVDSRYWRPTVDKAGNGFAVIRFLAPGGDEVIPYIKGWEYGFKHKNGKWYIERSLTTIGIQDQIAEYNNKLWNFAGDDDNAPTRKQAKHQKRKLYYTSNILVINDPANPENNGKVFLYKYGKKVYDKLINAMNPGEEELASGIEPINPFDFWTGCNFKLKICKVEDYPNYDQSELITKTSGPIGDDATIEKIWKSEYLLLPLNAPESFKSLEELEKSFRRVFGDEPELLDGGAAVATAGLPNSPPPKAKTSARDLEAELAARFPKEPETELPWTAPSEVAADDEDISYFEKFKN